MTDSKQMIQRMDKVIQQFHSSTAQIEDHSFKAFAGLMTVYLGAQKRRIKNGFESPSFEKHEVEYISNTVALIFDGACEIHAVQTKSKSDATCAIVEVTI